MALTLENQVRTLSLMTGTIVTGEDVALVGTVDINALALPISASAVIQASIISSDHQTILVDPVSCRNDAVNANWDQGIVVIEFSSSETADIDALGAAILELHIDDGKVSKFFTSVFIAKGTIDV